MCIYEFEYKLLNRLKFNWFIFFKWLKILSLYLSILLVESLYILFKKIKNKLDWVFILIEIYRYKFDILFNILDILKFWDENLILWKVFKNILNWNMK